MVNERSSRTAFQARIGGYRLTRWTKGHGLQAWGPSLRRWSPLELRFPIGDGVTASAANAAAWQWLALSLLVGITEYMRIPVVTEQHSGTA